MDEQGLIGYFHAKFQAGDDLGAEISQIDRRFKNSVILQYYAGMYYERAGDYEKAVARYTVCIELSPRFAPPRLQLGRILSGRADHAGVIRTLTPIFNKDTLDATGYAARTRFQMTDQIRLCSLLLPSLGALKRKGEVRRNYELILGRMRNSPEWGNPTFVEGWKNACFGIANLVLEKEPERARALYLEGLAVPALPPQMPKELLAPIDRQLYQGLALVRSYVQIPTVFDTAAMRMLYGPAVPLLVPRTVRTGRIRLGYLSPDFNKNAVGLFLTALIRDCDRSRFDVFCYYNHHSQDEFTAILREYAIVDGSSRWTNVRGLSDEEVCSLMRDEHRLDILVDLIGLGVGNRLGLIAMRPAPIIVNYLGYPDYTHLPEVAYRITDAICDPKEHEVAIRNRWYAGMCCERLIRMPRCFVCYSMFENICPPQLCRRGPADATDHVVNIGIFNRLGKHSVLIREVWERILRANPNFILWIKDGDGDGSDMEDPSDPYARFPEGQVRRLPFANTLPEYLEMVGGMDVCLDTYPYSGTTTTCSCLLMGVPVITLYNPRHRSVSNVTASIIHAMGGDEYDSFVCSDMDGYIARASAYGKSVIEMVRGGTWQKDHEDRRSAFLWAMNSRRFMAEYEELLLSLLDTPSDISQKR